MTENYQSEKILLPHNLLGGEAEIKRIHKLVNTAKELGGTVYDMAVDSGLLSAYRFMELQLDEEVVFEKMVSEDMTVVTEAYIHFSGTEEFDRVFLYSENAVKDAELKKEGYIKDGRFIIECDKLKGLHTKGYSCIYGKYPNEKSGRKIYEESFGKEQQLLYFKKWDEDTTFVGNGFNRALLVRTPFETVFVMPDIYAVQMSIRTYYAECMIREKMMPDFWIERIEEADRAASDLWDDVWNIIFGNGKKEEKDTLPESYVKLIYQIAYIKAHYPSVFEHVWSEWFEADDEVFSVNFDVKYAKLGISIGCGESYGVCRMNDGTIKRVPNMNNPVEQPLCLKYKFAGYETTLKNAGTAGSRIALIMKKIKEATEFFQNVTIEKVYVTCGEELPEQFQIADYMERLREEVGIAGDINGSADLIAYEQIAKQYMNGREVLQWAIELAKLPETQYVDRVESLLNAYEQMEGARLEEDEIALLYEFDEKLLRITLLQKDKQGKIQIIAQDEEIAPEDNMRDEREVVPGLVNPDFITVLGDEMQEHMLNEGLRALGIIGINDADRNAYEELKNSAVIVKRQFKRNDNVRLFFDNGYLRMSADYPIEKFETSFKPILKRNEGHLRRMLREADVDIKEIAKVYLAGSECEYPFVKKYLEDILHIQVYSIGTPECAAAKGLFVH